MADLNKQTVLKGGEDEIGIFTARINQLNRISESLKPSQLPDVTPTGLLYLPLEIRLQIYRYVIPRNRLVHVQEPRFAHAWEYRGSERKIRLREVCVIHENDIDMCCLGSKWLRKRDNNSILRLSKKISEEALDILYGENLFLVYLYDGESLFRRHFTEANRRRIRDVWLSTEYTGLFYPDSFTNSGHGPDIALWSAILPGLKLLRTAVRREEPFYHSDGPNFQSLLDGWGEWMRPYLECFSRYLSGRAVLQVDNTDWPETSEVFKKYLPNGYREIRAHLDGE